MEPLQILYLVLSIAGAFFLILSIFGADAEAEIELDVGDADFDVSDAESGPSSPSVFSIRTLATFILGFGMAGWVVMQGDGGVAIQLISGFGTGIVISFLYFLIMKFMYSMQGNSMITSNSLIGKTGLVTTPTTKTGIAQVKVSTKSGNYEYVCREQSGLELSQNETVKIISSNAGTLTVTKTNITFDKLN